MIKTRNRICMLLLLIAVSVMAMGKGKRVLFIGDSITDGGSGETVKCGIRLRKSATRKT